MKKLNPANSDIKADMLKSGIYYWQLADVLGISESTLYVWFRREFDAERKAQVQAALAKIKA